MVKWNKYTVGDIILIGFYEAIDVKECDTKENKTEIIGGKGLALEICMNNKKRGLSKRK